MKSAGNRGVVQSRLQVLHVHVFLAAPLSTCHMAQPRADQHQGGISVREHPYHPRPSADLTVQPLDHIVGADAGPVFAGKVTINLFYEYLSIPCAFLFSKIRLEAGFHSEAKGNS